MFVLVERLLILSMKMEKSGMAPVRLLGKLLGLPPVWCSRMLEKKILSGSWDPGRRFRRDRSVCRKGGRRVRGASPKKKRSARRRRRA